MEGPLQKRENGGELDTCHSTLDKYTAKECDFVLELRFIDHSRDFTRLLADTIPLPGVVLSRAWYSWCTYPGTACNLCEIPVQRDQVCDVQIMNVSFSYDAGEFRDCSGSHTDEIC